MSLAQCAAAEERLARSRQELQEQLSVLTRKMTPVQTQKDRKREGWKWHGHSSRTGRSMGTGMKKLGKRIRL